MKYMIILSSLLLSVLIAKDNTTLVKVDGMMCSYSCAGKVSTVVQSMKGVKECSVDFDKGIATVVYDDKEVVEKDIVDSIFLAIPSGVCSGRLMDVESRSSSKTWAKCS